MMKRFMNELENWMMMRKQRERDESQKERKKEAITDDWIMFLSLFFLNK